MDAKEAGNFLRDKRKKRKLTQEQVVALTSIGSAQYLSALESGRFDIRNSQYFRELVLLYGLSIEEIKLVNPDMVLTFARVSSDENRLPVPKALQEAVDLYGTAFPELKSDAWQQHLAHLELHRMAGDPTTEEWLELFLALRKFKYEPAL